MALSEASVSTYMGRSLSNILNACPLTVAFLSWSNTLWHSLVHVNVVSLAVSCVSDIAILE